MAPKKTQPPQAKKRRLPKRSLAEVEKAVETIRTSITPPPRTGPKLKTMLSDPTPEVSNWSYIRQASGLVYTTDVRAPTLKQLLAMPMFAAVPYDTAEKWCTEDRWVARRGLFLESWRNAIEKQIGSEIVRKRVGDLAKIESIFQIALNKLNDAALKAESWEGVAAVLVRIAQLMDDWREKVGSDLIPMAPEAQLPSESAVETNDRNIPRPQLSPEEARAAAKAIMHLRRDQTRAAARAQLEARTVDATDGLTDAIARVTGKPDEG